MAPKQVTPKQVTLAQLVARGARVVVRCSECGVETQIDPKFFISGARTFQTLDQLSKKLVCSACGSSNIVLGATLGATGD
jgi:transcription elongation factor Elf1